MSEPLSASGTVSHQRLMAAAAQTRAKEQPSGWWLALGVLASLIVGVWGSGPLAFYLVQLMPFDWMFAIGPLMPSLVMWLVGLGCVLLTLWIYVRASRKSVLRRFSELGVPHESLIRYELLEHSLRVTTDRIEITPKWEAVTSLERASDGWVVNAEQLTFLIPSGAFPDQSGERAFITEMLARMSASAQERSASAAQFLQDA